MKDISEIAISVEGVRKDFVFSHDKVNSVKAAFVRLFKSKQSKKMTHHALDGISFDVKKGEFFGIVGRNGSGKSTLLKILAGIYQPTKGSVSIDGKLVPFIELGVGFNPELTGRENVYLNGAMLGFSETEVESMYSDIVSFAELEDFMDQKLKNYSSGMQVRLAFSMATRSKADILLVDEVLAVGDADFQRKCFNYFKQLKKNKKTVVFVSHDMNAVREYCDRAVLIEKSKIIRHGNVAQVAGAYTKMFIESDNNMTTEGKISRKRWGDMTITFSSVQVTPDTATELASDIIITATAKIEKDRKSPIFGFTIKNGVGTEMFGTNTRLAHYKTKTYKAGEEITIKWQVPNILNDGDYSVDVTAIDGESLSEYDWWEEAAAFSVVRVEHTAYVVEPKINVEIIG